MEAVKKAKEKMPSLDVTFFSIYDRPPELPGFIKFVFNSPHVEEVYNNAAIFLGPSLQEGCALPPVEAMMCGCAVICTDIEGHSEYARDNETAILTPVKDVEAMAEKILWLVNNPEQRVKLAGQGNNFIKKFTWRDSANQLNDIWQKAVQNK
jgi:glycosyltransferase involved in cell wall biosynthesis